MKLYRHLVYAGTFDHLHRGHAALLDRAFHIAQRVSLGITSQHMTRRKLLAQCIEPYAKRRARILGYLKKKNFVPRVRLFQLSDVYGSSIFDHTMDAILVSEQTKENAFRINEKRKERGLTPLAVVVAKDVTDCHGKAITSERIRLGEIDTQGNSYDTLFEKTRGLPEHIRPLLQTPLGRLIKGKEFEQLVVAKKVIRTIKRTKPTMVITVGDIVSRSLEDAGFMPDVKIIDYRSRRRSIEPIGTGKNPHTENAAGTITHESALMIRKAIKEAFHSKTKQTVVVDGEEDLLAIPAILFSPLGSFVLYGQWHKGAVLVPVDEEKKKLMKDLIERFH